MKKCSLIIPLYKGKHYIKECIDDIIAQTYPHWELILMDDGSPDDTYDFVADIISAYPEREIALYRQENRGVAETRNTCVSLATGEYIAFIDQDDRIKPDYLEKLIGEVADSDHNIVLCGFERRTDDGKITKQVTLQNNAWAKYRVITPWARIYKRSFLLEHGLKFLTAACCEDFYLTIHAYALTDDVKIVSDYTGYIWRCNPSSVSNEKQRSIMTVDAVCDTFEKIMTVLPENRTTREWEEYCFLRSCIWYLLFSCHAESSAQVTYAYRKYFSFLETHFPNYQKNKHIGLFRPKGEDFSTRCMVWGFMLLKKVGLAKPFAKIWSKFAK